MRSDYVNSMSSVRAWFDWLPSPLPSVIVIVFSALIALLFSRIVTDAIPRLPGLRRLPVIGAVIAQMRVYIRFLLIILGASAGLTAASSGFSPDVLNMLVKMLACAFIMTVGFTIIRAFRLATNRYLARVARTDANNDITERALETQIRVLRRVMEIAFGVLTVASALTVFDSVHRLGVSLFASAGAASLVVGLSARPAIGNLIAGIQIAITQPIRMEDMLVINGDWAWVEEINATYVVMRTWDKRRYIVPLSYFLENPFQNWTHNSRALIGSVFLWLDYRTPMERLRVFLNEEIVHCPNWDGNRATLACQVADSNAQVISIRIIAGAANADHMWNLCCDIRERMLRRIRDEIPEIIPRDRVTIVGDGKDGSAWPDAMVSPPNVPPGHGRAPMPQTGPSPLTPPT